MKKVLIKNLRDTLKTNYGVIQKLKDIKNVEGSKWKH